MSIARAAPSASHPGMSAAVSIDGGAEASEIGDDELPPSSDDPEHVDEQRHQECGRDRQPLYAKHRDRRLELGPAEESDDRLRAGDQDERGTRCRGSLRRRRAVETRSRGADGRYLQHARGSGTPILPSAS